MIWGIRRTAYSSAWPKPRVQEDLMRCEAGRIRRQTMEDLFNILTTLAKGRY